MDNTVADSVISSANMNNNKVDTKPYHPQKTDQANNLLNGIIHKIRVFLVFLWIFVQHVIYFPEYVTWFVFLRPVLWVYPRLYWYIESYCYSSFIALFALIPSYNGHKIVEYGEDIGQYRNKRCVLTPNHQTLGDVPIIFSLLTRYDVYRRFMWIMDKVLQFTHFGMSAALHGDCFIQQNTGPGSGIFATTREEQMKMLSEHIRDVYYKLDRRWILLFPEGGLLHKRRAKSQSYAKRNDLPVLEHVSLPRLGGLEVIMNDMTEERYGKGNGLDYIIDITIGHPDNNAMSLQSFMIGTDGPREIHVYYRVIPVSEVPRDSTESLTNWLYGLFVEKEKLLAHFYEHGEFPLENGYKKSEPRSGCDNLLYSFVTLQGLFMSMGCAILYMYYRLWCWWAA